MQGIGPISYSSYYRQDNLHGVGASRQTGVAPTTPANNGAAAIEPSAEKTGMDKLKRKECQSCKSRKYQDGSSDPGVSFKTPTHVSPENAASAVRGHEQEHVVREQAKAKREDRKVVSQKVEIHYAVCQECGKPYVSGGKTTTVTKGESKANNFNNQKPNQGPGQIIDRTA